MNDRADDDILALEDADWNESIDDVMALRGPGRAADLLERVAAHARRRGVDVPALVETPYVNTIGSKDDLEYPGDLDVERRITARLRWNAMAMVVRANRRNDGIGGHLATYASVAELFEVGLNHIFRGCDHPSGGDHIWWQGHASPGLYARAFVEGRLTTDQLANFRLELQSDPGLSSYPHPWLMPDFWQYPTVSMGLGPIISAYQARFFRYLQHRGIRPETDAKVWAFLGDGEMDEPESTGVIGFAAREQLSNLVWVINCNLQRLDGPVRGNAKIVQELERVFRGADWRVIKVLWSSDWDPLFERDRDGILADRLGRMVDGTWQKCRVEGGGYMREKLFSGDPRLAQLVEHLGDDELFALRTGGHDRVKVHTAFRQAADEAERPTVILVQTVKGYGLAGVAEGLNIAHQAKKLDSDQLRAFRDRFEIPIPDAKLDDMPFLTLDDDRELRDYVEDHRSRLGGSVPRRKFEPKPLPAPGDEIVSEFAKGSERPASTTAVFVRVLAKLLRDETLGPRVVPIIPDESRTFGMDGLFRQIGIYSPVGQLYEPVDSSGLMYYRESKDGQLLQEGITEAGGMSSFISAGTSYASTGEPMIPFYVFYSMFGFQRMGDLAWAACDMRTRGFLIGGTAGRTTLNGEGLQHEDGHSHVLASVFPNVRAYDPSFAAEIAVIVRDGLRRMLEDGEDVFYYLTVGNEAYVQQPLPEGAEEGVVKGMYVLSPPKSEGGPRVQLLGSGSITNSVLEAQRILGESFGVEATVWSVTSYTELRREALDVERDNVMHPEEPPRIPYVTSCLGPESGVVVASSDYMKALPDGLAKWIPVPLVALGTDGFGRSETREALRDFFEVDAKHVAWATLSALYRKGEVDRDVLARAREELGIDPDKINPMHA